jgi:hypothetical protein
MSVIVLPSKKSAAHVGSASAIQINVINASETKRTIVVASPFAIFQIAYA